MEGFVQRMVAEHSELIVRIKKLNDYIYSDKSDNDNKIEFANKCIQLSAMKKYEEALRARLENQGVVFDGSTYFEKYGTITLENTNQETEGNNDCGKEE
jgi:hypothetical protein